MNAKQRFIKQCKEKFYECYKKLDGKDVVLFAAGGRAHMMVLAFKEMGIKANIRAILDNHCKEERYIEKIPVYNAKRIGDFSDSIFIVCSDTYRQSISQQVKASGGTLFDIPDWEGMVEQMLTLHEYKTKVEHNIIGDIYEWIGTEYAENRIRAVEEKLSDEKSCEVFRRRMEFLRNGDLYDFMKIPVDHDAYFDVDEMHYTQDEVFVDCEAYIGDSIDGYRKHVGQYRKIYALEPDVENCKKIQEYVENQKLQNIQLINAAVGKENRTVSFDQQGTAGSSVKGEGNNSVKLVCLDDVIADPVTFLKMDIEGFELDALMGAKGLIETYKPKLAICVYHKCEDPVSIVEYLAQLVPEYQFYMRHYTYSQHETVLYAV